MYKRSIYFFLLFFIQTGIAYSSGTDKLKPGFDPSEYRQLLEISHRQSDTPWTSANVSLPYPEGCKLVFRSDSAGLDNRWDLWTREDSIGIISIRGTTLSANSWAEDFYSSMVPAKGSIIVSNKNVFIYKLAESEKASVHTGWLLGLAFLSESITEKINEYHSKGIKDFLIMGHSQGGAIAYLLTSYLHYLDKGRIPDDVKFKTYCSAPPKPGNLFYSYDFDFISRGGWALRVSNTEDWVPQCPLSVQTVKDFSKVNPYSEKDSLVVKMNFIEKIIFDYIVGRLNSNLNDCKDLLNEYFGKMIYDHSIKKYLPDFPEPIYTGDFYFYPCGVPVVLMKQNGYDEFINTETKIPELFKNHMIPAYFFLLDKIYFGKQ
ncbi:MAG TPA: lipase family protein [Ignavibacteria bacterium]|nr:lipase family protein [Ignavibacteria bacterium]